MTINGRIITRGAAATAGGQWAKFGVQAVAIVVLSRLLPPDQFGRYAAVLAVVGVASVISDFGLSLAAVQATSLSEKQKSNLFWLNVSAGIAVGLLAIVLAPIIGRFFADDALADGTRLLTVVFVLNGAVAQYRAELNRAMRFKALALSDVLGQAAGLMIACSYAAAWPSFWALIFQQIASVAGTLAVQMYMTKWLPGAPSGRTSMASFLRFGFATSGTQVLNYLSSNLDSVLISRFWGASSLGVYSRAFQIFSLPLQQLASPMTRVALPVLSRVQSDTGRFRGHLQNGQMVLAYVLLPLIAFLAATANPLVAVILGDGWSAAGPILQILAVGGAFQALGYVFYWAFLAESRMRVLLLCEASGRVVMMTAMTAVASLGVLQIASAYSAGLVVIWCFTAAVGMRGSRASVLELVRVSSRPILLAAAIFVAVGITLNLFAWMPAAVKLLLGAVVCLGAMMLSLVTHGYRHDLKKLRQLVGHLSMWTV